MYARRLLKRRRRLGREHEDEGSGEGTLAAVAGEDIDMSLHSRVGWR